MAGMRAFFARVAVLSYSPKVATAWGEIQAHGQLRARGPPTTPGSPPAASPASCRWPLSTSRIFVEHEGLQIVPTR